MFKRENEEKLQWILLPIEIKVRELESRLLLACYAAKAGYGVIIGSKNELNRALPYLPRGLYFDKSISRNKFEQIKNRVDLGYVYGVIDEEGLSYHRDKSNYVQTRLSKETLKLTDLVYTWGKGQAIAIAEAYPEFHEKVVITGNPRIDLYRSQFRGIYEDVKNDLQAIYGKFILIPSNFAGYIHARGANFTIEQAKSYGNIKTKEDEEILKERLDYKQENLNQYLKAIRELSKRFSDYTIIIRPHPADNHNYWKEKTESIPNVKVIYKGKVTPWIMAAEAVIHHGCTTGLESYLLEVPCIAYLPCENPKFDGGISNTVSLKAYSQHELISMVTDIITNKVSGQDIFNNKEKKEYLAKHLEALEGELATEKIVNSFKQVKQKVPHETFNDIPLKIKIKNKINALKLKSKLLRASLNLIREEDVKTLKIKQQKILDIGAMEIDTLISFFCRAEQTPENITFKKIDENLFLVKK